jgi:hypothetical protein
MKSNTNPTMARLAIYSAAEKKIAANNCFPNQRFPEPG